MRHPRESRPAPLPAGPQASKTIQKQSFRDNRPETTLQRRVMNLVQLKHAEQAGTVQRMESHEEEHAPVQMQQDETGVHQLMGDDEEDHHPVQMKPAGVPVNDDRRLEREADVMGAKALQMKAWSGSGQDVIQRGKYGDSAKLARERYKVKKHGKTIGKHYKFNIWKRGREAQHLIPAQVCRDYGIPKEWANSAVNGMMLPSGRTKTHGQRIKALDKGKVMHIKGGGAHPLYNTRVMSYVGKQGWVKGKVSYLQFTLAADHLRKRNRPKKSGPTQGYVNDLKI